MSRGTLNAMTLFAREVLYTLGTLLAMTEARGHRER